MEAKCAPNSKKRTKKEILQDKLKELKDVEARISNNLRCLEEAKFSQGDFVIHKDHGKCIVMDFHIDMYEYGAVPDYTNEYGVPIDFGYIVIGPNTFGKLIVSEDYLVPATNATKVLFDQSK